VSAVPVAFSDWRVVIVTSDITERKRAEDALCHSVALEELITIVSTNFINIHQDEIDKEIENALQKLGEFVQIDRSYIFQLDRETNLINNTHEWCAPGIESHKHRLRNIPISSFKWLIEKLLGGNIVYIFNLNEIPAEGDDFRKELEIENIRSILCVPLICSGEPVGMIGFDSVRTEIKWEEDTINLLKIMGDIIVNALERKKFDEALHKNEEKYRTITENINVGIYRTTPGDEGRVIEVNPAFVSMFGFNNKEELLKVPIPSLYENPDDRKKFNEQLKKEGSLKNWEALFRKRDGTIFTGSDTCVVVKDENGNVLYYDGIFEDITERKRMEQMVLQSEKMASLGTLAAGVAHEINNPIGYIYSNLKTMEKYAETLRKHLGTTKQMIIEYARKKGDNELLNTFEQLHTNFQMSFYFNDMMSAIRESLEGVEKVKKIVLDLRDFARAEKYEIKPANINEAIEKTLNIIWNELKYKAEVVKDLGQLPDIKCDIQRITQVLMNILMNAVQAIEKRGKIAIKTYTAHNAVVIQISDTGKGISRSDLSRIFDAFFTTKGPGQGTGLGLTIALKIIQEHKGTITVSSEVGKGATFTILLPVEREKPVQALKVLVVDDDEDCRLSLAKEIQFYNPAITAMTAKDGFEVGDIYNTFQPDVVILDITMPGMNGFEVCRKIVSDEGKEKTKVIMITGYDGEDLKRKSFEAGAVQFLEKPIHLQTLFEILDTILS
jgi:PAS domain S-box-containing protein